MKITPLRTLALAATTFVILSVSSRQASADSISIRVGTPPPPVIVEHRWAPPYRTAVWIDGHHEWIHGHWVWVSGYYTYPPYRGAYWVPGHYRHGFYRPGHWDRY